MSDTLDQPGIASFSRFDAETARRLRASLALIARQTDPSSLGRPTARTCGAWSGASSPARST